MKMDQTFRKMAQMVTDAVWCLKPWNLWFERGNLWFLSEFDVGVVGFGEGGLDEQSCEDVEDAWEY